MYEPDTQLRDFENVVMKQAVAEHVREQVLRHVEDAWADRPNIRHEEPVMMAIHMPFFEKPKSKK
jgi:type I restriction enzyme M protein